MRAILTDIEGTTTDIRFVHEVLFPYARRAMPAFVRRGQYSEELRQCLQQVRELAQQSEADTERVIQILDQWMQQDSKVTPLKTLQGLLWRHGYEGGDFKGHVYPDVAPCLRAWQAAGVQLAVYSSGSVAAQKLLFGYSEVGDLRPLFCAYFDTRIGTKRECKSYLNIAQSLAMAPNDILFLSDVVAELDAAREVGLHTCQLVRAEGLATGDHAIAASFEQITLPSNDRPQVE